MDIDELIYGRCDVNLNASNKIDDRMEKGIKSSFEELNVKMLKLSTSYVFPRIFRINDNAGILVWDSTYWELFQQFLMGLISLNESRTNEARVSFNNMKEEELQERYKHFIAGNFSYFLALKVSDEKLAYTFADYYAKCKSAIPIFSLGISLGEVREYYEVAQLYSAVHERIHYIYKQDTDKKKEDLVNLNMMLDNAKMIVGTMNEQKVQKHYLQSIDDLLKSINECYYDKKMQEEILCDTYAFNECFLFCRIAWGQGYSIKQIVNKCMESINVVKYFNSNLMVLQLFWSKKDSSITQLKKIRMKMTQRNYLAEIICCMQLQDQGFGSYIDANCTKINSFENNYNLEDILYSRFLNEEAIEYWLKEANKQTITNIKAKEEKFKILNWRVKNEN